MIHPVKKVKTWAKDHKEEIIITTACLASCAVYITIADRIEWKKFNRHLDDLDEKGLREIELSDGSVVVVNK